MRVLFASTRGAGHYTPLVPLVEAAVRAGHEVLVAGPAALADLVERGGYPFWEFDDPPEDELGAVWSRVPSLSPDEQNVVVLRDIFGRLDTRASLPRLRQACEEWGPDLVLRDPNEFGSALAAELRGVPHARVTAWLSEMEVVSLELAAAPVDELRRELGLPADPEGELLRASPFVTSVPPSLDDPVAQQPRTLRFRDPAVDGPARAAGPPGRWPDAGGPLVYVSFGSVAGGIEMTAHVYAMAVEAVADLPVRVLLTLGQRDGDPASLGPLPPNVHVEAWVSPADVLAHADAVVSHGGPGTTFGALAAGLPVVAVPLFADQPYNARRVEAVGVGLAVDVADGAAALRGALERVLAGGSFRDAARRIAAEMRALPTADETLASLV
jgi:UDP:flavonoid glycosyltransferase YjiC (YdhE family)